MSESYDGPELAAHILRLQAENKRLTADLAEARGLLRRAETVVNDSPAGRGWKRQYDAYLSRTEGK